ncbi:MAG: regulatory protein RecX, partial [Chloroflexota bacterium]
RMGEALIIANRFLAHRPRTAGEVRSRLRRAHLESEVIDAALAELEHQGLLDDRRFAALWVENRTAFSPRSARVIGQELRRKGVDREVIDQTFAGAEMGDEAGLALDAGRKRLHSMSALDEESFRRRMGGFLSRRGFDYQATRAAVEQLWTERLADS